MQEMCGSTLSLGRSESVWACLLVFGAYRSKPNNRIDQDLGLRSASGEEQVLLGWLASPSCVQSV